MLSVKGIVNEHNTCFLIALVQSLNAIKKFHNIEYVNGSEVIPAIKQKSSEGIEILAKKLQEISLGTYYINDHFESAESLTWLWNTMLAETTINEQSQLIDLVGNGVVYDDEHFDMIAFHPFIHLEMIANCNNLNDIILNQNFVFKELPPHVIMFDTTSLRHNNIIVNKEIIILGNIYALRAGIYHHGYGGFDEFGHFISICDYDGYKICNDSIISIYDNDKIFTNYKMTSSMTELDDNYSMTCCFYEFITTTKEREIMDIEFAQKMQMEIEGN